LGTDAGPQLRFGAADNAILERLRYRERVLAEGFAALLANAPLDLIAIARAGLCEGDDLHNRLSSANAVMAVMFESRKHASDAAAEAIRTMLNAPLYFLNLWMPACALMLDAARGEAGSTLVTHLSSNGVRCAVELAGQSGERTQGDAPPVRGPWMNGLAFAPPAIFPAAIGDSGIIDAFGLGGQALRRAPSLLAAFAPWLAPEAARVPGFLAGVHPALGIECVVDAAQLVQGKTPLLLSTGMVDQDGRGLLGRGVARLEPQAFEAAVTAVLG
jgi:hypothetical protein